MTSLMNDIVSNYGLSSTKNTNAPVKTKCAQPNVSYIKIKT